MKKFIYCFMFISLFMLTGCSVQGEKGEQGIAGKDGLNGTIWYSGTEYLESQGVVGDFFYDTDDFNIYIKTDKGWNLVSNIKGEDGSVGKDGLQGQQGEPGKDGSTWYSGTKILAELNEIPFGNNGDFYLNTTTYDIFKKDNDIWVKIGNIKGQDVTNDKDDTDAKYNFKFYVNIDSVLTDINEAKIGASSIPDLNNANFAVYIDGNDIPNIILLNDYTLYSEIETSSDMILDLGGKTLTFNSNTGLNVTSGNVTIDGTTHGSKISLTNDNQKTTLAQVNNGSLTLNGGTYETTSNGVGTDDDPNASVVVGGTGELNVVDAEIIANDTNGGTLAGILVEEGGSAVVSNSDIEVTSLDGLKSDGIRNYGTMTLTNTNVAAYANYTANAAHTDYATSTRGISNDGTMTLKNCYVYGTHSGIRSVGTLYIDGGIYEGYGHGGIYFAGTDTTSYVKNATITYADMKNGYDDGIAGTNNAGLYIGGANNVVVYMDSCKLSGPMYPMVLRSSGGESNNALYISNSNINEDRTRYPRNDGSTNKIYIGVGNNFGVSDTYKESGSVATDVDYGTLFPEY